MGKSRKEIAYDYIKPKIVFCELKPGDILDEKKIIEELGFSRTPIREAISELAEEKLVTIMPRRGIEHCWNLIFSRMLFRMWRRIFC